MGAQRDHGGEIRLGDGLQALLRALAPLEKSPRRLNTIISQAIGARNKPGRFITLAYVILDAATGRLNYSMAGHHPPIIVGPHGTRELQRGGLPLGILAGVPYQSGEDHLLPGESMLLFTDGVIECRSPEGRPFGERRLREVCRRHQAGGAQQILDGVRQQIIAHRGGTPAADDLTFLVIQVS